MSSVKRTCKVWDGLCNLANVLEVPAVVEQEHHEVSNQCDIEATTHSKNTILFQDKVPYSTQMSVWRYIAAGDVERLNSNGMTALYRLLRPDEVLHALLIVYKNSALREYARESTFHEKQTVLKAKLEIIASACSHIKSHHVLVLHPVEDTLDTFVYLYDFETACQKLIDCMVKIFGERLTQNQLEREINPIIHLLHTVQGCCIAGFYAKEMLQERLGDESIIDDCELRLDDDQFKQVSAWHALIRYNICTCFNKAIKLHDALALDIVLPSLLAIYYSLIKASLNCMEPIYGEWV